MRLLIEWIKPLDAGLTQFASYWKEYNIEALWPIIVDGTIMGFSIYVQGHIKFIRNFNAYHIGDYRVYTNDGVQLNF